MKILGIVLIVAGIAMMFFRSFSFTKENNVVDVGPIEINKKEKKTVQWPQYAGGVAILGGIALLAVGSKKRD